MTVRVCRHHHRHRTLWATAHYRRRRCRVVHRCPRHPRHRHRRPATVPLSLCSAAKRLLHLLLRSHHPRRWPHHHPSSSSSSLLLRLRCHLLRHLSRVHPRGGRRRRRHLLHHSGVHPRRSRSHHTHGHPSHHLLHHLLHLSRGGHRVRLETHDGREEEGLVLAREVGPGLCEVVAVRKPLYVYVRSRRERKKRGGGGQCRGKSEPPRKKKKKGLDWNARQTGWPRHSHSCASLSVS